MFAALAGWNTAASSPAETAAKSAAAAVVRAAADTITPLTLSLEADRELLRGVHQRVPEHLQNIEQGVLVLEDDPTDANTLNSIFRAFHTFKGGSGFLNLTPIKDLAHELESLLDAARQHKLDINSAIIDVILKVAIPSKIRHANPGPSCAATTPATHPDSTGN